MKKPRLDQFDPETNPSPLASPLDDMPSIAKPLSSRETPTARRPLHTDEQAGYEDNSTRPYEGTPDRPFARPPGRRTITRSSFEFFLDQVASLRRFSLDEKARGETGSMSQMVREAVDAYIAKRNRTDT